MLTQSWWEGMGGSLSRYYPQASWVMESLWLEARWAGKLGIKATKLDNKWIPVLCGMLGMVLGVAALYLGIPDFPATDPLTAAAVGGASGLAATGIDQAAKQLKK